MPSVNIPVKTASDAGTDIGSGTVMDTVNGNNFVNDGHTILKIENTDATSKTVNVKAAVSVDGNAVADKVLGPIAAGATRYFSKLNRDVYGSVVELTCTSALVKVTPLNEGE